MNMPIKITSVFLVFVLIFTMLHITMVSSGNIQSEVVAIHQQDSIANNELAKRSFFTLNNSGEDLIEKDDNSEKRSFSILRLNVFIYLFYKIFYNKP
ncbi:MAG: hypothetical protein JJU28_03580 [Cyclobacteriaceae bacterium]|nr:hypothetical protein [Cyclobacteriaceae bacterium]